MQTVEIGYKAYDPHELLPVWVAREDGLFKRRGIRPRLIDTSLEPPETPPSTPVSVALGSALMNWLSGAERRVEMVSCARPMFQLCVHQFDPQDLSDLTSATLATYPAPAPPARFLKFLLNQRLESGESPEFIKARTDVSRLGLLVTQSANAALVSSKVSPPRLDRMDLSTADWLGEHLCIPTTGLATTPEGRQELGDTLPDLVDVLGSALRRIHGQPESAVQAMKTHLGLSNAEARGTVGSIRHFYTRDGSIELESIRGPVQEFAEFVDRELPGPLEELYSREDS